jgi:hypothetical protein
MNNTSRDRAFERFVVISHEDKDRFISIINDIPRDNVIRYANNKAGVISYVVSVKKQELLMIKLSIKVISITRPYKSKNGRRPRSNLSKI